MPQWKRWARHLPALFGVCLLVGAVYVVWQEFRHLKIAEIKVALAAIPHHALLVSFVWTFLSYGLLTFYDRLGTIYAGHKVSYAAGSRSRRSAPTRSRTIWGSPRCRGRRCGTGCMPIGG